MTLDSETLRINLRRAPRQTIRDLTRAQCDPAMRQKLCDLAETITAESRVVSGLRIEKGKKSRAVGLARKQQQDTSASIQEVAAVSRALKQSELQLTASLEKIVEICAVAEESDNSLSVKIARNELKPAYFLDPSGAYASPDRLYSIDVSVADDEWNRYVKQHPRATCYHDARWRALIHSTFGHTTHYIAARDESNAVCGVLPLVLLSSHLFGRFIISMPFFNYGGPLSDNDTIDELLWLEAARLAGRLCCSHAEIRETRARENRPVRTHKVAMTMSLPASTALLEQQLDAKVRSQARRAMREGAETVFGGMDLLDEFYSVFAHHMRDLGTPVYSKQFFKNILQCFSDETFIAVVRHDRQPVAAAFLLSHGTTLEIPWACALRTANGFAPNMYLYRCVLDEAINRGYAFFDFGRSSKGAPTYRFKKQWGAEPQNLYWHYWLPAGCEIPRLDPGNTKYQLVIKAWQRMPLWVTNTIGPGLVKNLP